MTGENETSVSPVPQPGGRAPAPGQLGLVQSFLNTHFSLAEKDRGEDLLVSPASLLAWLRDRELISAGRAAQLGQLELGRALQARDALRSLAGGDRTLTSRTEALRQLNSACAGAGVELRFDDAAPRFVLAGAGAFDEALGLILGITAGSMIDGRWSRLKICPGSHCGWAFYDSSRNRTGRWCSMSVCGGRVKARTHYRRYALRAT